VRDWFEDELLQLANIALSHEELCCIGFQHLLSIYWDFLGLFI